jgi:hypothetical protein
MITVHKDFSYEISTHFLHIYVKVPIVDTCAIIEISILEEVQAINFA